MTEFEERLTHEYSTLAEQYAQEQQQLSGQVAVGPALVASVVGRIDVDAPDLAVVRRQQRLQRGQVVALDDQVVVQARLRAQPPSDSGEAKGPPNEGVSPGRVA